MTEKRHLSLDDVIDDEVLMPDSPVDWGNVIQRRDRGKKLGLPIMAVELLEEAGHGAMLVLWHEDGRPLRFE
ncbi:MAG TPA: hypothetical protein VMU11_01830 [Verrucomicrobiae bacterium]|nr:hypothetical protein [Verrucomicrobiae bacterium]